MVFLAAKGAVTLDLIFFGIVIAGILIGVIRGLFRCLVKWAGTIFSVIFAFTFCTPMQNSLERSFGLTSKIGGAIGSVKVAGWLTVILSFILIVVIVKVGAWLISKIGTKALEQSNVLKKVNRILGGIFGLAFALFIVFILLTIVHWINIGAVNDFIHESLVVGRIYEWRWFQWATRLPGILS